MSRSLGVTRPPIVGRRALLALAPVLLSVVGSGGCTVLGPATIRGGRAAYNEAIVATNNEQILAMIVRARYSEPSGLLAVSSVTANLHIGASAGAEFGFGSKSNYRGNLVPFTSAFAYEENPTISYTPVEGEKYLRQLMSPMPLDLTVLLLQALRSSPLAMTLLLRSINEIGNPDFVEDASADVDARFTRVAELLARLARQGHATWAREDGATPSFALALTGDGDAFAAQVAELQGLLGVTAPPELDGVIALPLRLGLGKPEQPEIRLETRSLFDLVQIVAASVEVPDDHVAAGIAGALPPTGPAGHVIRIRCTDRRPEDTLAAFEYRDHWFSIDAADTVSKQTFQLLESLISVRIADTVDHGRATPALTVPVSR